MKSPTPRELAIFASVIITCSVLLLFLLLKLLGWLQMDWIVVAIITVVIFGTTYYAVSQVLQKYIYRKIKLIYKTIRKSKMDPSEKSNRVDMGKDIMEEVENDVEFWAETQTREIDELKKLEEYRRNFMGDISHELKTPIFNIQGYLHTLLDGGLEDETINLAYIKKAVKNVDRLHNIVQDLESISTMESGATELNVDEFEIKELVELVFEEQYIKAKDKGIELRFKVGADKNFKVLGDKEKISQVLVNLVSNSIKYGKIDGKTQISFYDMDKVILIEVADDGIGIQQEHLNRLFDRFYRVDKSRSRKAGGTGLGLAIVKHILEIHQQSINVRSTVGRGSTFGFTLEKVD
jgi:two-component system phosphate regulon sensor histidine kinase PhoR